MSNQVSQLEPIYASENVIVPIETLDELKGLPKGTEVIVREHSTFRNHSYTGYGIFNYLDTLSSPNIVLDDSVKLPFEIKFDANSADNILGFFRDPQQRRKEERYLVTGFPHRVGCEVYKVVSRSEF